MTRVEVQKTPREYTLTARGHAGYARNGDDIVCAALSFMLQTLAAAARDAGALLEYEEKTGFLRMRAALNDATRAQLSMCLSGLGMLQRAYPGHVKAEKR